MGGSSGPNAVARKLDATGAVAHTLWVKAFRCLAAAFGVRMRNNNTEQEAGNVKSTKSDNNDGIIDIFIICCSFAAFAMEDSVNINLAVASNFYGVPPSNSAITDLISAFEALHPGYTVTVVDNGATATLEDNIINGDAAKVDLLLAADTATPQDLLVNHFELVALYNSSRSPPLYTFNYAGGILALLSNKTGVNLSCEIGTCGYSPSYSSVAIADPELAPSGVAAQSVLIGTYGLTSPLSSNSQVHEYANITATCNAVIAQTDPVGFVAMSAICSNGQYPTPGKSALAYFPVQASPENPSVLTSSYNPLTQAGIAIRMRRSDAQKAELNSFVAFLTDFTSPPTPDSPMTATLRKYCYSAP
jgi:ABC-type molybdate transport system substrate-binding protein